MNLEEKARKSEAKFQVANDDDADDDDEGPNYLFKIDEKSRKRSKSELDKLLSNSAKPNSSSKKSINEVDQILFGSKHNVDSMVGTPLNAPKERSLTEAARDNPNALVINERSLTDDPFAEFKSKVEQNDDFMDELFGKKQSKNQANFGGINVVKKAEDVFEVESKKATGPRANKAAMPWEKSAKSENRTIPNGDLFMTPGMVGD